MKNETLTAATIAAECSLRAVKILASSPNRDRDLEVFLAMEIEKLHGLVKKLGEER